MYYLGTLGLFSSSSKVITVPDRMKALNEKGKNAMNELDEDQLKDKRKKNAIYISSKYTLHKFIF